MIKAAEKRLAELRAKRQEAIALSDAPIAFVHDKRIADLMRSGIAIPNLIEEPIKFINRYTNEIDTLPMIRTLDVSPIPMYVDFRFVVFLHLQDSGVKEKDGRFFERIQEIYFGKDFQEVGKWAGNRPLSDLLVHDLKITMPAFIYGNVYKIHTEYPIRQFIEARFPQREDKLFRYLQPREPDIPGSQEYTHELFKAVIKADDEILEFLERFGMIKEKTFDEVQLNNYLASMLKFIANGKQEQIDRSKRKQPRVIRSSFSDDGGVNGS